MPNQAKNHEDCRKTVCLLCMRKAGREVTEFLMQKLISAYETNFDFDDSRVPCGLCDACRTTVRRKEEGKDVVLPPLFDFSTIRVRKETRDHQCNCLICQIGHSKLNERSPLDVSQACQSLPPPPKRCTSCLSIVGRGIPHHCNQYTYRENLRQLAMEEQQAAEQIASQVLSTKEATPGGSVKISQARGGPPIRVKPGNFFFNLT